MMTRLTKIIILFTIMIENQANSSSEMYKPTFFNRLYFDKIIPEGSKYLLKSLVTDKSTCFYQCNINFICLIVIWRADSQCSIYRDGALADIVPYTQSTSIGLFIKENQDKGVYDGLIHYWPLNSDPHSNLKDYITGRNFRTQRVTVSGGSLSAVSDKFNRLESAIYLNSGHYELQSDVYFNGSFTILGWVKVFTRRTWTKLVDCAQGVQNRNSVMLAIFASTSRQPLMQVAKNFTESTFSVRSTVDLPLNQWVHLAGVLDGTNAYLYMDGVLVDSGTGWEPPVGVMRPRCYIGRSNWGDPDPDAYFDEIKIFNRGLSHEEVLKHMNLFFY